MSVWSRLAVFIKSTAASAVQMPELALLKSCDIHCALYIYIKVTIINCRFFVQHANFNKYKKKLRCFIFYVIGVKGSLLGLLLLYLRGSPPSKE